MYHNAPPLASLGSSLNGTGGQGGGSNNNWNESQRMRGKVRYGSRNQNSQHRHHHARDSHHGHHSNDSGTNSSGYGSLNNTNSIPSINKSSLPVNNMVLNSGPSPRGNVGSHHTSSTGGRGKGSRRQNRNHHQNQGGSSLHNSLNNSLNGGLSSGNVGAGGSIYLDNSSGDHLNATQVHGNSQQHSQMQQISSKYQQQNQLLPRIGSSQQPTGRGSLQKRNSGVKNQQNSSNAENDHNQSQMPNLYNARDSRASPTPMLSPSRSNNQLNSNIRDSRGLCSGSNSIKGYKPSNPHNWTNQDNLFVMENVSYGNNNANNIYCVLDGHGEHGHIVSKRCTELLPQLLTSKNCLLTAPPSNQNNGINYYYDYKRAFLSTQSDLNNNTHTIVDASCSGATCVLVNVNLTDGVVITANCGDSRAIIGSSKKTPNGQVTYVVTPLSYDHKPDRQDERKRILACNGRVGCRQMAVPNTNRVSVPNASGGSSVPSMISVPVGPCRVWYSYKGDTLGLAMSRSLGDCVVHQSGVSAEPELVVYKLNNATSDGHGNALTDEFIVLATDGIWDVLDNNAVTQLVVQNFINPANQSGGKHSWSPQEAAQFLTKTARSKWEKLSPMIDDITCVVVKL